MKTLANVNVKTKQHSFSAEVLLWERGDPFPDLGPSVGVDTETELITDTCLAPKVVVLGVFDFRHKKCYIVYWQDVVEFVRQLCARDIQQHRQAIRLAGALAA